MIIRALVDNSTEIPAWLKWRIVRPFRQLRRHNIDAGIIPYNLDVPDVEENVDLLIIPRLIVGRHDRPFILNWFRKLRAQGTKIVFEVDDDIWSESFVEHMLKLTIKPTTTKAEIVALLGELEERVSAAQWVINQVDAITVSTNSLANYVQTLTDKPVYVIPNAIDVDMFEKGLRQIDKVEGVTTVGWFGGRRDINELAIMIDAWHVVAIQCPNVIFVTTKWLKQYLEQFDIFTDKLIGLDWEDYEIYSKNLQVDIGCCCVDDSGFCSRKSTIKAWEYSLAGALAIGTSNLYSDELGNVLTTNSVETYAQIIKWYVDNPDQRIQLARVQRDHVLAYHNLKYEWSKWVSVYNEIKVNVHDNQTVVV